MKTAWLTDPDQLSGGQRQRVAIARAMVMKRRRCCWQMSQRAIWTHAFRFAEVVEIIENLNEQGITLIVVTHDPDIGSRVTRRQLVLHDGRIATRQRRESRRHENH